MLLEAEVKPGTAWQALNGAEWVHALVHQVEQRPDTPMRVYFTVAHRPEEMLNCYAEAFVSRYTPAVQ